MAAVLDGSIPAGFPVPLLPRDDPRPAAEPGGELAFRQLRHNTNNTLQRLLADISGSEVARAPGGPELLAALEARILAGAALANALFAVTGTPEPPGARLRALCRSLSRLHTTPGQALSVSVVVSPAAERLPPELVHVLVRVARELVENALRHGLYARNHGEVEVSLSVEEDAAVLTVADDGWGWGATCGPHEGLDLVRDLLAPAGGWLSLGRREGRTVVRAALPAG